MEKQPNSSSLQYSLSFPIQLWAACKLKYREWPKWWNRLSLFQRFFPLLSIGSYWVILRALKGLRTDHIVVGICLGIASYIGPIGRFFLRFTMPFFLTGIIYDSQRHFADAIRGRIHVKEPYLFDKYFFGISTSGGTLTPNEWWQNHSHPALDLITGFAYLAFFAIFILIAAYFYFIVKQKKTMRMTWGFFWLNMVGYSTYYWYAAAPPWYVALYGLGPARLDVAANVAGCARFDALLGTHFFSAMYGRAADVFGAIPSLHVAYPLLALYFAIQFKKARIFCLFFYALMCFSAVYLNHHYILDILWGSCYAIIIGWGMNLIFNWRDQKVSQPEPALSTQIIRVQG